MLLEKRGDHPRVPDVSLPIHTFRASGLHVSIIYGVWENYITPTLFTALNHREKHLSIHHYSCLKLPPLYRSLVRKKMDLFSVVNLNRQTLVTVPSPSNVEERSPPASAEAPNSSLKRKVVDESSGAVLPRRDL